MNAVSSAVSVEFETRRVSQPRAMLKKHRVTVTEWEKMEQRQVFPPESRLELMEGEIIEMAPIGSPHSGCVNRLTNFLAVKLAGVAIVSVQNPIQLGSLSEPLPDIALLRYDPSFYSHQHPTVSDIMLLIEVSDTTIAVDRKLKVPLYARYGVPEVWLVNLNKQCLEVYLQPAAHGYANKRVARRGETVTSSLLPQLCVAVTEVLGLG